MCGRRCKVDAVDLHSETWNRLRNRSGRSTRSQLTSPGGRFPSPDVGNSACGQFILPVAERRRASALEVFGARVTHRAVVQPFDESFFRPQLVVQVAGYGRRPSRRHHRRRRAAWNGRWRKAELLLDGEFGQRPDAVEIVPLTQRSHPLQVGIVAVAT